MCADGGVLSGDDEPGTPIISIFKKSQNFKYIGGGIAHFIEMCGTFFPAVRGSEIRYRHRKVGARGENLRDIAFITAGQGDGVGQENFRTGEQVVDMPMYFTGFQGCEADMAG